MSSATRKLTRRLERMRAQTERKIEHVRFHVERGRMLAWASTWTPQTHTAAKVTAVVAFGWLGALYLWALWNSL